MILLTGATGAVGYRLLGSLLSSGSDLRVLVRNPQDLGSRRVDVQMVLGDLGDAMSVRNAMKGVDSVVHLAATFHDQGDPGSGGSIEEVNGLATARLLRAAEECGAERFIFTSALGANQLSSSRFLRSKAAAERDVMASPLASTVLAPSVIHSTDSYWQRTVDGLSLTPVTTLPAGTTRAMIQPVRADEVAQALVAVLDRDPPDTEEGSRRIELASDGGISQFTYLSGLALRRHRRSTRLPLRAIEWKLKALAPFVSADRLPGPDDLDLLTHSMNSGGGATGLRSLGVEPTPVTGFID